jgi:hypothetical protein
MWLPALPVVGIGLLLDAGPAWSFGLAGMALSFAILCTGPGLLERKHPRRAQFVARWSLVQNTAVLGAIAMYSLDGWVGQCALCYAVASLVHGVAMLRAAGAVLRTNEGEVTVTPLDPLARGPACSSPSSQPSYGRPS